MKKEDLKRFQCLSGMDDLKIDKVKSLCYEHGYQLRLEERKQDCMIYGQEIAAGSNSDGKHNSSPKFQETCKEKHLCNSLPEPVFPHVVSVSKHDNADEAFQKTDKENNGPAMMPPLTVPNAKECMSDASITLTGTATKGIIGPPIGIVDIGISKLAYFFQVALPGVRRDYCHFSCEIESDGKVHIQGSTSGGKTIRKRSRVFYMKLQQWCPPGPFTLTFSLPGPVDPRLASLKLLS